MFEVFIRDWWKIDSNGNKIPYPDAPKTHVSYEDTQDDARAKCKEYNDNHHEGDLSRKAEYRSV